MANEEKIEVWVRIGGAIVSLGVLAITELRKLFSDTASFDEVIAQGNQTWAKVLQTSQEASTTTTVTTTTQGAR
jgi:hypothetical protein